MHVHLAYLAQPTRGGWPTYTAHLAEGLRRAGHEVHLWRVTRRAEHRPRPFRHLTYQNTTLDRLAEIARLQPLHITAAAPAQADQVAELIDAGASITVHDPTELRGEMPGALSGTRRPVVVIRATVAEHVAALGLPAVHVAHPYARSPHPAPARTRHAVSFARLDWDKHTDAIAAANTRLAPGKRVELHGAENRLFTHHKLTADFPGWRRSYRGPFDTRDLWAGAGLAASAHWAVDMSTIDGDGGGTQYTHLEALDGGARLLLNAGWFGTGHDDPLLRAVAVTADPGELAAVLAEPPGAAPPGTVAALLARHAAHRQAARLLDAHQRRTVP
ncbi:glycosyltransferase family 4 protein [Actinomadura rayongensis]|uniref:Glycosyltransferase n=1 Tax=Actinomadura rayongensis TaxID=1429076 RepID=A0A6I4WM48_9ACTN|nr:glycosyltransferase family 4 protein [Actinomadura rayongensis]MXQ67712.1 hypothetical protein [Actinomadura rayongensis]